MGYYVYQVLQQHLQGFYLPVLIQEVGHIWKSVSGLIQIKVN